MTCPRCGNEWDVTKSPCDRCGLLVRLPHQLRRSTTNTAASPQSRAMQPTGEQSINRQDQPASPRTVLTSSMPLSAMPTTPAPSSKPLPGAGVGKEGGPTSQPLSAQAGQNTTLSNIELRSSGPLASRRVAESGPSKEMRASNGLPARQSTQQGQAISDVGRAEAVRQQQSSLSTPSDFNSTYADQLMPDMQRSLRPPRLVTDPLTQRAAQRTPVPVRPTTSAPVSSASLQGERQASQVSAELRMLMPGTLLRGGRYRLQEIQNRQEWLAGAYEAMWVAQDAQRSAAPVVIRELVTPESGSMMVQSMLRAATMALTSVGRHPRIPTLWDAFSDQGRNFFVFEPVGGESLLMRMRRTGRALSEQDVIECCLQMTEVLELLAQQSPPLVHGLIRPEHIIIGRMGSQYALINFSIVLAGGATQLVSGMDRARLSPYAAPEFARGAIDIRSDLYSLLATAYHAVTGSVPVEVNSAIPQAQRLNPNVSARFDAILSKGLQSAPGLRYQRPGELRKDLLALYSSPENLFSKQEVPASESKQLAKSASPFQTVQLNKETFSVPQTKATDSVAQVLPSILAPIVGDMDEEEGKVLLPRPEELPPMKEGFDMRDATLWLAGILICLIMVVILSRGLI